MTRKVLANCPLAFYLFCVAILFTGTCQGQETFIKPEVKRPLVIQTVPQAELKQHLSNERPLKRTIFDDFLRARSENRVDDLTAPSSIQIREAIYEARLSPDGLLEGSARVEIVNQDSESKLLPTSLLSLIVSSPKWKDRDDPVIWGMAPDRRVFLQVPKSGILEFNWSARPSLKGSHRIEFDLGLFRATRAEFALFVSRKWKAIVNGAVPADSRPQDGEWIRYSNLLGAADRLRLQFDTDNSTGTAKPTYWISQSTKFDIGRQGMDVVADLGIETSGSPLSSLPLRIDSNLELVSARLGDQPLSWSRIEGNEQGVELHFEPPLVESGRKLRLEARSNLEEGKMTSLPRIRPPDAVWRNGEVELHTSPLIELVGIELEGARFSDSGPLAVTRGGETRRIRITNPSAEIRCAFRSPEFRGHLQHGAHLKVSDSAFELESRTRLQIDSGETFDLTSTVPTGWVIDSVESNPTELIENWSVVVQDSVQQLSVRLSRAINVKLPLRLRIKAHLPRVGEGPISTKNMFLASFNNLRIDEGLLKISSAPGINTTAKGENTLQLNPATLPPSELELIPELEAGAIYRLSPEKELVIEHATSVAEFRAQVDTRTLLESGRVFSRHRLTIHSQRLLDRVQVNLIPGTGDAVSFEQEGNENSRLEARLVSSDPKSDVWELRFSEANSSDFSIFASETNAIGGKSRLRVLQCEGAASQESTVSIFASREDEWDINAKNATPIIAKVNSPFAAVELACFRFSLNDIPTIEAVRRESKIDNIAIWGLRENRITLTGLDEEDLHQTTLQFETRAPAKASFQIPANVRLLEVRVDNNVTSNYHLQGQLLEIPLDTSDGEHFLEIKVTAPRPSKSLGISSIFWKGVIPQFPILVTDWTICSPPGTAVLAQKKQLNFAGCFSLFHRSSLNNDGPLDELEFKSKEKQSKAITALELSQLSERGWILTYVASEAGSEFNARVIDEWSWRLAGWCSAIFSTFATIASYHVIGRRRWWILLVILGCWAGCLFTSEPWTMLLSGVLLGAVLAGILCEVTRVREFTTSTSTLVLSPSRIGLIVLIWLNSSQWYFAQEAIEPQRKKEISPTLNAIDPVDAEGKPVGDFVYVSPQLLEEVTLRSPWKGAETCLLESVRYRIRRSPKQPLEELLLAAEYHYFASNEVQSVQLPLNLNETPLSGEDCDVDGELRRLPKANSGRIPQIELLGSGAHTIRVELRLPLRSERDALYAAWKALPLGSQELDIETDSSIAWTLDGVHVKNDPGSRIVTFRLSPGREVQLTLRSISTPSSSNGVTLRHDAWISVTPGSISVENIAHIAPDSGANSFVFELDDGMMLESVQAADRRILTATALGDRRFRVPLESPTSAEFLVRIQCSIKSGLGINRVSSTGVLFPNSKVTSTRIGASASPDYSIQGDSRADARETPMADFTSSWPADRPAPQVLFSVDSGRTWSIVVRPSVESSSATLHTEYVISASEIQVRLVCDIAGGGEPASVYSLIIPPAMSIESVSVLEGNANRLVRFARTSPQRLSLFMRTATNDQRQIILRGRISIDSAQPLTLPRLSLENSNLISQSIRVFRGFDAIVELTNVKGLQTLGTGSLLEKHSSETDLKSTRLIGAFVVPTSAQQWEANVTVATNRKSVTHNSVTYFELEKSKWRFRQDLKLNVEAGELDELEVELPPGVQEPLVMEPSESFRIVPSEAGKNLLVITPASPWKGTQELRIAGAFDSGAGNLDFDLAPLRLLHSSVQQELIAATKQVVRSNLTWKGVGAEETPSPKEVKDAEQFQWFKGKSEHAKVRLHRIAADATSESSHLMADVLLEDRRFVAELTWIWSAASTKEVVLSAPVGVQVLRIRSMGSSARVSQIDHQTWRLSTSIGAAPPVLEVICIGEVRPETGITLPTFKDSPVARSFVNIRLPRDWEAKAAKNRSIAKLAASYSRLRMLEQVKRDVQPLLPTLGVEESIQWRQNWAAQWDSARSLDATPWKASESGNPSLTWLREADAGRKALISEQETNSVSHDPTSSKVATSVFLASMQIHSTPDQHLTHFVFEGAPPPIHVERPDALAVLMKGMNSATQEFPWIVVVGAGVVMSLLFLFSFPKLRSVGIVAIPVVACAALGVVWWFYLSPNWFGPVVASAISVFQVLTAAKKSLKAAR